METKNRKVCNGCGTDTMALVTMSEGAWERHEERHKKEKFWITLWWMITILLLVASNICWIVYENQFETITESTEQYITATQDGEGTNLVSGGDINYGANGHDKND